MSIEQSIDSESEYDSEDETKNVILEPIKPVKLRKDGKPKRVMTKEQLDRLALARVKAQEVIKAKKKISMTAKDLRKEKIFIKRLELEKEIKNHNDYKMKLMVDSGAVDASALNKKVKVRKVYTHNNDEEIDDESKIKDLEEQINLLRVKKPVKKIRKPKVVIPESESEYESEVSESEEEIIIKKKPTNKPKKEPKVKEESKEEPKEEPKEDPHEIEKKRQIRLLFPDY